MKKRMLLLMMLTACSTRSTAEVVASVTAALTPGTFVQQANAQGNGSVSSLSKAFAAAEKLGDSNVVLIGWNNSTSTIASITDTQGLAYHLASPIVRNAGCAGLSQAVYHATGTKGETDTIKVTFSGSTPYPDLRVLEYAGAMTFDQAAAGSGAGAPAAAAPMTLAAGELVVAGGYLCGTFTGPGAGFTQRALTAFGALAEDEISASGSLTATGASDGSAYVFQAAAFTLPGGSDAGVDATPDAVSETGADVAAESAAEPSPEAGPEAGQDATIEASTDATAEAGEASTSIYPVHATGRYLVDNGGAPYLLISSAPHSMTGNYSVADAETYFTQRAAQGFNAAWLQLITTDYAGEGRADGSTYDGIQPFLAYSAGVPDFSQPNPAYFARVDTMIQSAASHGILVLLDPIDAGGWALSHPYVQSNGAAKCTALGQYIGARYASFPNVLWLNGNDWQNWSTDPTTDALLVDIAQGIKSQDPGHLQTVELDYPVSNSTDDARWLLSLGVNFTYSYCATYAETLAARSASTMPVYFGEGAYEGEQSYNLSHVTTPYDLRLIEYWSLLSGAAGTSYGDHYEYIEDIIAHDPSQMNATGATQISALRALFGGHNWQGLVPDQNHTVVTAGFGTFDTGCSPIDTGNYATTAAMADGRLAVSYLPTVRTVTVNLSTFAGPVTARWYDPSSGTYAAIGTYPNTGSQTFTPSGSNSEGDVDWALVLESQ